MITTLFDVALENVIKAAKIGTTISKETIQLIAYADDVALI